MLTPIHELKLDQIVEVKVGHAPYQVIAIDGDFVTFIGRDGLFSDDSGYAMVLNVEPIVNFVVNSRGVIHAQIGDSPLCGHRFTGDSVTINVAEPTCEHCKLALED